MIRNVLLIGILVAVISAMLMTSYSSILESNNIPVENDTTYEKFKTLSGESNKIFNMTANEIYDVNNQIAGVSISSSNENLDFWSLLGRVGAIAFMMLINVFEIPFRLVLVISSMFQTDSVMSYVITAILIITLLYIVLEFLSIIIRWII